MRQFRSQRKRPEILWSLESITLLWGLEQAGTALNILILDCCRDDPYSRSWRGKRSAAGTGGLFMPGDMPQGMFIVSDDGIITGYGFTSEDDYLFELDRHTGKTVSKQRAKSGPEAPALKGDVLYVSTYNTDYRFTMETAQ